VTNDECLKVTLPFIEMAGFFLGGIRRGAVGVALPDAFSWVLMPTFQAQLLRNCLHRFDAEGDVLLQFHA